MFGIGDFFSDLFGSGIGGMGVNLYIAEQQRRINERAQGQQEAMFGRGLGMFGFGGIPGVEAVSPPQGMDISRFPAYARTLAERLYGQSGTMREQQQRRLGQLGPQGEIMGGLAGLPGQFGAQNQAILDQFGGQAGDITGQFQRGAGGLLGQFGQGAAGLLGQFGQGAEALRSQFGAGAAGITGGFEDRLGTAMGMLEGRGQQAEEDIATRFRESLGAQQQGLRARGFGGTMAANIAQGSAVGESAEQRRLQEQLRGERLGLYSDLSGQGLAARERLLGAGTGLGQQLLGAGVGLGQQLLGAGTGLGQQLLGAGTGLQAGFAGQQLGAGQAGQQFLGGLGLSALGQRGSMGQFFSEQLGRIQQQDLANRFQFGQYPIGIGQWGAGQALGFLGPGQIAAPQQSPYAQIQPYGG